MRRPETVLLVVDALASFAHDQGETLMRRLADRAPFIEHAVASARRRGWPVIYVNDDPDDLGDPQAAVAAALAGPGGHILRRLAPREADTVLLKPRWSAFEDTRLAEVLEELGARRVVVIGTVTEMCVRESALDAARAGFETVVLRGAAVPIAGAEEGEALRRLAGAGVRVAEDAGP